MSQGFPWYVPSCGPSGVFRWEQPLLWNRSVASSRGKTEQKLRVCCPDGEERKAFGAPHEVSQADLFPKCHLAGVCRDSPCRCGASLCPSGDSLSPALPRLPALLLACYLGRQPRPSEVSAFFQQGLTQPQVLFGACSRAPLSLVTVWCTPSFTPALRGQCQG